MVDIVVDIYAYSNMYCTSFLRYHLGKQSSHYHCYMEREYIYICNQVRHGRLGFGINP